MFKNNVTFAKLTQSCKKKIFHNFLVILGVSVHLLARVQARGDEHVLVRVRMHVHLHASACACRDRVQTSYLKFEFKVRTSSLNFEFEVVTSSSNL